MSAIKTVAVTGASGFVGSQMVRELLSRGLNVRALVRAHGGGRPELPEAPEADRGRVQVVVGDASDPRAAQDLLAGAHACINLVGIIREARRVGNTFQRAHVDVPRVLTAACERLGVRRFIQMSALGVQDAGVSEYQRSKFEGEQVVRRSSLDWTVLRPGLIHGPKGDFIRMAHGWITGHAPPFIFLPYFTGGRPDGRVPLGGIIPHEPRVQPIAVEDVCKAFADALENPATFGEVYNLAGPETLTWSGMLKFMRSRTPNALPSIPFGVPGALAARVAQMARLIGLGDLLPFDEGMARMGAEDSIADTAKVAADLPFKPRPFRATFAQYAADIE